MAREEAGNESRLAVGVRMMQNPASIHDLKKNKEPGGGGGRHVV